MSDRSLSSQPARVRVLLVEDSPTELYLLCKMFEQTADLEVVGTARNGREALDLLPALKPDIVCTDYHMPVMDGLEFILKAKLVSDCPIMVLSVAVQAHQKDNIFQLLAAGAVAVVAKPAGTGAGISETESAHLFDTVRELVRSRSRRALAPREPATSPPQAGTTATKQDRARVSPPRFGDISLIAIGASTGGPQILAKIFRGLPANYPVPIVCVQHISAGFVEGMMSWLRHECALRIDIARAGAIAQPGHIYFAPDAMDLTMDARGRFQLERGRTTSLHCPGVDPFFNSVASQFGRRALGILLSGMGRDGAAGLKAMRNAGASTIAQNEASSVIFGMPAAAIGLGAAEYVLSTEEIAQALTRISAARPT